MLKPTEHYEKLLDALDLYWHDKKFKTLPDCYAHILLDLHVYMGDRFYDAVHRSAELAIEQHKKAIKALEEYGDKKTEAGTD